MAVRLNEIRLSKIQKQSFVFGRYDLVTPVTHFRFVLHIPSKGSQRILMRAIAGDHLPTCVATAEEHCQGECCCRPDRYTSILFLSTGLGPVSSDSILLQERPTEPWLQELRLAICAARSKQSGGITGKILSTRFDGISDITIKPPMLQQSSQKVSGDISRNAALILHRRDEDRKLQ